MRRFFQLMSFARRLQLQARVRSRHSALTFSMLRKENCVNPRIDLRIPKTGSTVCFRRLWRSLPGSDFSVLIMSNLCCAVMALGRLPAREAV